MGVGPDFIRDRYAGEQIDKPVRNTDIVSLEYRHPVQNLGSFEAAWRAGNQDPRAITDQCRRGDVKMVSFDDMRRTIEWMA